MTYSTSDVALITGIDPQVLKGHLNARRIVPDVATEVGRGRSRLFSSRNLFEVMVLAELHKLKVGRQVIDRVLEVIRTHHDKMPRTLQISMGSSATKLHLNLAELHRELSDIEMAWRFCARAAEDDA